MTVESSRSKQTGHDGSSNLEELDTPVRRSGRAFTLEAYTEGGNAGTGIVVAKLDLLVLVVSSLWSTRWCIRIG